MKLGFETRRQTEDTKRSDSNNRYQISDIRFVFSEEKTTHETYELNTLLHNVTHNSDWS